MPVVSVERVAVRIRAEDGASGGLGAVECARPTFLRRLGYSALMFLAGLVGGAIFLPIPLIHLFGLMFFLAMSILAVRRLTARTVVRGAEGRCPSCKAEGSFYVGFGGRRLAFPMRTACPQCHAGLELEPAAPGGTGGAR
jgi:hypothetical protein